MKHIGLIVCTWLLIVGSIQPVVAQNTISGNSQITGSLDSQFFHLNRISRSQDGFKLIRRPNIDLLRKNVLDSIQHYQTETLAKSEEITGLHTEITRLRDSLNNTNHELAQTQANRDPVHFMGIQMTETAYHLMVWAIILVLLIALLVIIFRTRQSQITAREAKQNIAVIQEEYDQFRKKSLEKEQKLKRQLQDEINKGNG